MTLDDEQMIETLLADAVIAIYEKDTPGPRTYNPEDPEDGRTEMDVAIAILKEDGYRIVKLEHTGGGPSYVDDSAFKQEFQIGDEL